MPEMAHVACSTTGQPEAPRTWPCAIDQGCGIRKSSLVNLLYKSKVMPDLQSGTESATAKAQASKSGPSPILLYQETKRIDLTTFCKDDVQNLLMLPLKNARWEKCIPPPGPDSQSTELEMLDLSWNLLPCYMPVSLSLITEFSEVSPLPPTHHLGASPTIT